MEGDGLPGSFVYNNTADVRMEGDGLPGSFLTDHEFLLKLLCIDENNIAFDTVAKELEFIVKCFQETIPSGEHGNVTISLTDEDENSPACVFLSCVEKQLSQRGFSSCEFLSTFSEQACTSEALRNVWGVVLLFLFVSFVVLLVTSCRDTQLGALTKKNLLLRRDKVFRSFCVQVFALSILVIISVMISVFSDTETVLLDSINLPEGTIFLTYDAPNFDRRRFYGIFLMFGPLIFLCVFTYAIAATTAAIVQEKETRVKETLRIAGMTDMNWSFSWIVFVMFKYLPMCILTSVICRYGNIFPNQTLSEIALFFSSFMMFIVGFSVFFSVFVNANTKVAALGIIIISFALVFITLSEAVLSLSEADLLGLCVLPSLCFAWGIRYMFSSALVLDGIDAYDLGLETINLPNPVTTSWVMILVGYLYFLLGLYLQYVIPQKYGIRKHWLFPYYSIMRRLKRLSCCFKTGDTVESIHGTNQLEIKELKKVYYARGHEDNKKVALDQLTLTAYMSEITMLIGINGAGKSTTFNILTGISEPTSGQVNILGHWMHGGTSDPEHRSLDSTEIVNKYVGYVPQYDCSYPQLTVKENLELIRALRRSNSTKVGEGVDASTDKHADADANQSFLFGMKMKMLGILKKFLACFRPLQGVESEHDQLLVDVDLVKTLGLPSHALSGGQKRKLALCMALLGNTKVLLLDEVTSGVDPASRRSIWNILRKYKKGRIIICTTHFLDEADYLGDTVAILSTGKIIVNKSPQQLKLDHISSFQRINILVAPGKLEKIEPLELEIHNLITRIESDAKQSPNANKNRTEVKSTGRVVSVEFDLAAEYSRESPYMRFLYSLQNEPVFEEFSLDIQFYMLPTLEEVFLAHVNQIENAPKKKISAVKLKSSKQLLLRQKETEQTSRKTIVPGIPSKGSFDYRRFKALVLQKRIIISLRNWNYFLIVLVASILLAAVPLILGPLNSFDLFYGASSGPTTSSGCAETLAQYLTMENPLDQDCCNTRDYNTPADTAFLDCMRTKPQCILQQALTQWQCMQTFSPCAALPRACNINTCCDFFNPDSAVYVCITSYFIEPPFENANHWETETCPVRNTIRLTGFSNAAIESIIVMIALSFVGVPIIAAVVLEREPTGDTKFIQRLSGMTSLEYWTANYTVDQAYVLFIGICIIVMYVFYSPSISNDEQTRKDVIVFGCMEIFTFTFALVPFCYALSFGFTNHSKALVFLVVFMLISGVALGIAVAILTTIQVGGGGARNPGIVHV